ncbi:hypothetical protein Q5H92_22855 [Hymenobacter sp. M29]|uniref:Uncharacterized protein n=1 Tax=Hymenobacter mellowenesis TaxID=3063995 RepID=A0ABT9AH81_9BACT|nr:hypothetical protein [Hymenobacter sp. M29]MDO7849222.1 hypothetical protein [Hymenobacter sp. M29]
MRLKNQLLLNTLTQAVDLPAEMGPMASVDARLEAQRIAITGQQTPIGPRMQNRNNALRLDFVESRMDSAEAALLTEQQATRLQQQVIEQLTLGASATGAEVVALRARIELVRAAGVTTQAQLDANAAADALTVARVQQLETQEAADHLADAAVLAYEQQNDARVALLEARLTKDEAAIATAQAKVDAAEAHAQQGIAAAATAQSKADTAQAAAAAAQASATTALANAATNATALATLAAEVVTKLPAALVQRFSINTPGVTLQALTPATFPVVLPKAFSDNNYFVFFTKASGAALLNVQLSDTATKTATSFTCSMQQTGLASLLVAASTAEVLVVHA